MNPRLMELALRKQRLQITATHQRADIARFAAGLQPSFDNIDHIRGMARWAREHAPLLSGAALLVAVARPRLAWRVVQRGWVAWLFYRRFRGGATEKAGVLALPLLQRLGARLMARMRDRRRRSSARQSD